MKQLLIAIIALSFMACGSEKPAPDPVKVYQEKQDSCIKSNLNGILHDMGSYQPVSTVILSRRDNGIVLAHKYRAKNELGALVLEEMVFLYDSAHNVILNRKPFSEYNMLGRMQTTQQEIDSLVNDSQRMLDSMKKAGY